MSEKRFFTAMVSAPSFFRYAAASKVLEPERITKFLVSSIIPARSASASRIEILHSEPKYCISSVAISLVEDANGSWKNTTALSIWLTIFLWWSITTTVLAASYSVFESTNSGL